MRQLSPQDAQFLYMESEQNLTHLTNIQIFDPSTRIGASHVKFQEIITHIESRLDAVPMLKQRLEKTPLEIDYPYWVDDEYFDLEYHMRHGRLPEPSDWRQFCIHMARYHSRPLDMKKPLWEMYVVEGLDNVEGLPKGCYAIATKIHHSAVDGVSLMRFFSSILDKDIHGQPLAKVPINKNVSCPVPTFKQIITKAAGNNLRSPIRLADTLLRSAPTICRAAQQALLNIGNGDESVPDTRFNGAVSPHKNFDAVNFSLDSFKKIRTLSPQCKLNDVVLAICSGALRRYLSAHRELPNQPLVAWVPINARSRDSKQGQSEGNKVSAMTAPIHTNIVDPIKRLNAIIASTRASKKAKSGFSARLMTDITQQIPSATQVITSKLVMNTDIAARACNLFVSNVPGPQDQAFMNGARLVSTYGLAPLGNNMGLFIGTPSYNGQISFNVISTREIMPDIEFFTDNLKLAHDELLSLVENQVQKKDEDK